MHSESEDIWDITKIDDWDDWEDVTDQFPFTGEKVKIEINLQYESTHLTQSDTGLSMVIYTTPVDTAIRVQRNHSTEINIMDTFIVSVSEQPQIIAGDQGEINDNELENVYQWISLNRSVLLEFSNQPVSTIETLGKLKPV